MKRNLKTIQRVMIIALVSAAIPASAACWAAWQISCGGKTLTGTALWGTVTVSCYDSTGGDYTSYQSASSGWDSLIDVNYTCSWSCTGTSSSGAVKKELSDSDPVSTYVPAGSSCPVSN